MSNKTVKQRLTQRDVLIAEIASMPHLLHGSLVERFSGCSRPNCRCKEGHLHGPRTYLSVYHDGRQCQKYIRNSQVSAAKEGIDAYRRLREVVNEITRINVELMKEDAYED